MKKFLSLTLSVLLIFSVCSLAGCTKKDTSLKFGAGSYTLVGTADAGENNGYGQLDITYAAVTVDADDKIVACALDTLSLTAEFTADGKAQSVENPKTKRELGDSYTMMNEAGNESTWAQQADAFEKVVAGKTLEQVKALVAENNKGTDPVITAGCTIEISEFVKAIEKACQNTTKSSLTSADTLKVTSYAEQSRKDATEEEAGENGYATTLFAAAVNAEGKVVEATSDCIEVTFTFDKTGKSLYDTTTPILSKREKGDDYTMANEAGEESTWAQQADAFDAQCVGKTGAEIANLVSDDGKGVEAVQTAGCTIYVSGLVKAAAKIG